MRDKLELKELKDKKGDYEEERKGNRIIKWTPFPQPNKPNIDFSAIEPASIRMTQFKSFPVTLN